MSDATKCKSRLSKSYFFLVYQCTFYYVVIIEK